MRLEIGFNTLIVLIVGVATICLLAGGCGCLGVQASTTAGAELSNLDIDQLNRDARLTSDLTKFREGEISEAELVERHDSEGGAIELRNLEEEAYTFMIISYQDGSCLIVLPGTTNRSDIERDLMFAPVADEELGINLHEGFRAVAMAVRADLAGHITTSGEIRVTGYSLGGATAVILAAYLEHDGFDVSSIITFGQPRVTDEEGVGALDHLALLRIISGDDPICSFPTGYHHFGDALILLDGPAVVSIPYGADDYTLLDDLVVALNDSTFEDHVAYAARMADKVGENLVMVAFSGRSCYLSVPMYFLTGL